MPTKEDTDLDHSTPYEDLTPDVILAAIDSAGWRTSGSLLALNSYENRVYQAGLDEAGFIIAKFYRPERWDTPTILEEHAFSLDLAAADIPVVPPLADAQGQTLHDYRGYRFALFPRRGGRAPSLDDSEHLRWLGRMMGRLHALGASRRFEHRPALTLERFGRTPVAEILASEFIPDAIRHNFALAANTLLEQLEASFEAIGPWRNLRLHGDCHPGNILWTEQGPHFVDLDDCLSGPAMQDIWMLLSGSPEEMSRQLQVFLEGYRQFFDFDPVELHLIEPLRALRLLHYNAWLARRWSDPAFPQAFPWFASPRYWEDQMLDLRLQAERMQAPVLNLTL